MHDSSTLQNASLYRAKCSKAREAVYDYDNGQRYTYGDLEERADKLAWFLTHKLGLRKGDRMGFCANNSVSFIDAYYAACKTGIILTTYNCLLRERELLSMVENEDPSVIFYSEKYENTIRAIRGARGSREFISLNGKSSQDRYSYQDIIDCTPTYWARGVKLVNAYGMTEIGPNNLVPPVNEMTLEEIKEKWNSAGKPMFFNQVRVVDEHGEDVPQGARGEMLWKSNLVFSGYWKDSQATTGIVKNGWVCSGDVGYCDRDGCSFTLVLAKKEPKSVRRH